MKWVFDHDRPIYTQIIEQIKLFIASGEYSAGDKLPSVRELAQAAGVNPNTMQRAFAELESEGLVFANRTSGRFITEDMGMVEKLREELASEAVTAFLDSMKRIGYDREKTIELIRKNMNERRSGKDE